jgi:hypothetical protein
MVAQARSRRGEAVVWWGYLSVSMWNKSLPLWSIAVIRRFAPHKAKQRTSLLHAYRSVYWTSLCSWLRPPKWNIVSECLSLLAARAVAIVSRWCAPPQKIVSFVHSKLHNTRGSDTCINIASVRVRNRVRASDSLAVHNMAPLLKTGKLSSL